MRWVAVWWCDSASWCRYGSGRPSEDFQSRVCIHFLRLLWQFCRKSHWGTLSCSRGARVKVSAGLLLEAVREDLVLAFLLALSLLPVLIFFGLQVNCPCLFLYHLLSMHNCLCLYIFSFSKELHLPCNLSWHNRLKRPYFPVWSCSEAWGQWHHLKALNSPRTSAVHSWSN